MRDTNLYKTHRRMFPVNFRSQWRPMGSKPNKPWTHDTDNSYVMRPIDSVTYGPNWPQWRLRLKLGHDATTYLSGVRRSAKFGTCFALITGRVGTVTEGFGRLYSGNNSQLVFPSAPSGQVDSVAERMAASRFLADYNLHTRHWKGGAAIAEFSETVGMLSKPIDSLYRHTWAFVGRVGRLRKVYRRDPVKYGKLLGSLWISYAFGISPLVNDINGAYNAVKHLSENLGYHPDLLDIRGNGTNRYQVSRVTGGVVSFSSYAKYNMDQILICDVKYRGKVRARPPGIGQIAQSFGVGFEDILPSVWEAVPWSWLVDYFVNVNEILDSVRLGFADFVWVNRTIRNRNVHQYSAIYDGISPADKIAGLEGVFSGGQGYTQAATVNRVSVGVPYPSWQFGIPGLPSQFANVSALYAAIRNSKPSDKIKFW